jgi:hypothetical protein
MVESFMIPILEIRTASMQSGRRSEYGLGLGNIEGTSSPGVAVAGLMPTGVGYFLGWARDRKMTTIHVQP